MGFHISLAGRKDLCGEIYRQIRQAIVDGRFAPGDRLLPSRQLARELGVSRSTVTLAYERLAGEGFARARTSAGTFVATWRAGARRAAPRQQPADTLRPRPAWDAIELCSAFDRPAEFDFRTGMPDTTLFPHDTWRRLVARSLRHGRVAHCGYGHPAGRDDLREAIARHVGYARGVRATAQDVIVTNGTQQALDIVARALLAPGDDVAVEDPGYCLPAQLFASLGLRVTGVPVDEQGLVVDALPHGTRAVYVTPSHQYPLGIAMSLPRRQALLEWAAHNRAAVIEDDYDSEFRFGGQPLEPLHLLDTAGVVIYVGSFSKTLLPGLRLGFVVAPRSVRAALHKAKYLSDWRSPELAQAALARFIEQGDLARHVRRAGAVYRRRHELLSRCIERHLGEHLELLESATGLHLAALARNASTDRIAVACSKAAQSGVAVQRLSGFAVTRPQRAGIVLGYGAIAAERIEDGMQLLRTCFDGC